MASPCGSTARATPPSPSSLPSTAAARPGCAPPTSSPEPATAAARLSPPYRCFICSLCFRFSLCFKYAWARCLSLVLAVQKLLSECQSHRECQLPVHHLLFGRDPCPGTAKYLHVDYKCKPSESWHSISHITPCTYAQMQKEHRRAISPCLSPPPPDPCRSFRLSRGLFRLSLPSAEHKRLVVCEGGEMILRCKPPRVLNIYAAVYGRSPDHTNTCPSHLRRPPPFGEWLAARGQAPCPIKMSNNNNIIRSEGTGTVASTIL